MYITNEGWGNTFDQYSQIISSTDQGTTWQASVQGDPAFFTGSLALGPTTVYATTSIGGVFRSSGDGNWVSISSGTSGPHFALDTRSLCVISDSIIIAIDSFGSIWRTMNSGGIPLDNPYKPPYISTTSLFTKDTVSVCSSTSGRADIEPGTGLLCTPAAIISQTISGPDAPYFSFKYSPPIGPLVPDSEVVIFHPDAGRDYHATLTITMADGKVFTVALNGRGADSSVIEIEPLSVISDTVGWAVLPIVIRGAHTPVDFRIVWDTGMLSYEGTYDANGTMLDHPVDAVQRQTVIHINGSNTLSLDSTTVYARFHFYPERELCTTVRIDTASFSLDPNFCGKIVTGSATICAPLNCATPLLIQMLRGRAINFRIAPNPAANFVEITSSLPVPNASIQILNALGEIEQSISADLSTAPYLLDLSALPSGVKFVRIVDEGDLRTMPILVSK